MYRGDGCQGLWRLRGGGRPICYLSPGYNPGQKVLRTLHFLTHRRPTLRIWRCGDPSPTPPWSMLFNLEKKCSGHTWTLFLLGGGEGYMSLVNRTLEGSTLKLDIKGTFFLTFLSKIVGLLPAQDGPPQGQVLVSYNLTEKSGNSGMRTV